MFSWTYAVQVKWDNGGTTWEPIKLIKECDPYTLAKYAHEKKITELKPWKWTKIFTRNPQDFLKLTGTINAAMRATKKYYKFGVEVPYTVSQAIIIDKDNKNNPWNDVVEREIKDVDALKIFISHDNKESIPKDNKFISFHFVFDMKYDGRRKVRLASCWSPPHKFGHVRDKFRSGIN